MNHNVTSEHVPAGVGIPDWLHEAFLDGQASSLLLLNPNEFHLQQTLERMHAAHVTPNPQQHLTINRLVRLLHVDLRLPVLLDDEASNLMRFMHDALLRPSRANFPSCMSMEAAHGS